MKKLAMPMLPLRAEANAEARTPGGLIGKTRQNQKSPAGIFPTITGTFLKLDRDRATVEGVDDPPGLIAESAFGPTSNH